MSGMIRLVRSIGMSAQEATEAAIEFGRVLESPTLTGVIPGTDGMVWSEPSGGEVPQITVEQLADGIRVRGRLRDGLMSDVFLSREHLVRADDIAASIQGAIDTVTMRLSEAAARLGTLTISSDVLPPAGGDSLSRGMRQSAARAANLRAAAGAQCTLVMKLVYVGGRVDVLTTTTFSSGDAIRLEDLDELLNSPSGTMLELRASSGTHEITQQVDLWALGRASDPQFQVDQYIADVMRRLTALMVGDTMPVVDSNGFANAGGNARNEPMRDPAGAPDIEEFQDEKQW